MCGVMGYVGRRYARERLLSGLERLEYRGYDSAGIAITANGRIEVRKSAGKMQRLDDLLESQPIAGKVGIGHTRWATHGVPNDVNAHPHTDASGDFVLVHNGIIENFLPLKEQMIKEGHEFRSDTDTEVLVHLVADEYDGDLIEAVRRAIGRATGAYALVVMSSREPGRIVAARMISPLVVGFGEGETFLASDIPAILPYTRSVLVINDGEMVDITAEGATVQTIGGEVVERDPMEVTWDAGQAEKGGYPHFMLKEIYEQPAVIDETLRGRLQPDGSVVLEDVDFPEGFVAGLEKVWITACGTAYHAGLVGRDILEKSLRIPIEIDYAHELRYRDPLIRPGTLTIAISQSGETADTLSLIHI